jgi:hypothetical protein
LAEQREALVLDLRPQVVDIVVATRDALGVDVGLARNAARGAPDLLDDLEHEEAELPLKLLV